MSTSDTREYEYSSEISDEQLVLDSYSSEISDEQLVLDSYSSEISDEQLVLDSYSLEISDEQLVLDSYSSVRVLVGAKLAVPDRRYALLDDEEEDKSGEPGIPYFLNDPTSPRFHLLMIGEPGKKEVARYIYYRKDYQEVVGTMGKGEPCYVTSIYLRTVQANQLPQHVTDQQVDLFHPHDPRRIVIDEVISSLHYPALHADVSHLRTCLEARDVLKVRRDDLRRLEAEATKDQFHLDMNMSSVRKRLQYAQIIPLISDRYVELMTKPTRPRHSSELCADSTDEMPLPPRVTSVGLRTTSSEIAPSEGGGTHASGVAVSPTAWMSAS
ncbi:hypothetical protein EDB89DRAFT_2084197 [Lactarius sanguifluus]|nr:hypothetical protein EDB89DRAFT_2084197 [Lactarius sanguifluus]